MNKRLIVIVLMVLALIGALVVSALPNKSVLAEKKAESTAVPETVEVVRDHKDQPDPARVLEPAVKDGDWGKGKPPAWAGNPNSWERSETDGQIVTTVTAEPEITPSVTVTTTVDPGITPTTTVTTTPETVITPITSIPDQEDADPAFVTANGCPSVTVTGVKDEKVVFTTDYSLISPAGEVWSFGDIPVTSITFKFSSQVYLEEKNEALIEYTWSAETPRYEELRFRSTGDEPTCKVRFLFGALQ